MLNFKQILLATKNKGKIKEFRFILGKTFDLITLLDLDDKETVIEDGKSFYENALKKAMLYNKKYNMTVLAEDSGLEVKILGNKPGIYSHRFAGEKATDKENNEKLLSMLRNVKAISQRKAQYKAVCVLIHNGKIFKGEGICKGFIDFKQKGKNGFGYDPLFYYPKYKATFGQVSLHKKSLVSHRAKAIKNLLSTLKKEGLLTRNYFYISPRNC